MMRRVGALGSSNPSLLQVDSNSLEEEKYAPTITNQVKSGLQHKVKHKKDDPSSLDGWKRGAHGLHQDASSESSFVSRGESSEESAAEAEAHATALLLHESAVDELSAEDSVTPCYGLS